MDLGKRPSSVACKVDEGVCVCCKHHLAQIKLLELRVQKLKEFVSEIALTHRERVYYKVLLAQDVFKDSN